MYGTRWLHRLGVRRAGRHRAAAPLLALLLVPALARADDATTIDALALPPLPVGVPPPETPGIPSDAELEASKAVVGEILIDNQNIFNLEDPKDNYGLFRLADRLHPKTRARVIRDQLLFKTGDRYSRRPRGACRARRTDD